MSEVEIVKSDIISYPHGFSTRYGGVSTGVYESLDLGMNRGDDEDKVKENYHRFLGNCGIDREEFVCGEQVHGSNVMIVGREHARKPYGYTELFKADGYVTSESGVPLVIFIADCIPLLMTDEKAGVIAAVHSGWRGTVQDIEKNAVDAMISLGASYENIKACIGPAIGRCCFEVGAEVIDAVRQLLGEDPADLYDKKENGKFMLDLQGVLKRSLMNTGIHESNIDIISECTMCLHDKYWSHRYTGGMRGSLAAVVMKP